MSYRMNGNNSRRVLPKLQMRAYEEFSRRDSESRSWDAHCEPRISRSWNEGVASNAILKKTKFSSSPDYTAYHSNFKKFDPIEKCKSAGIIPYAIHNNQVYFLFQKSDNPLRKKDDGWNDYGGKQGDPSETTAMTAAREFSEETSCLFYLVEKKAGFL